MFSFESTSINFYRWPCFYLLIEGKGPPVVFGGFFMEAQHSVGWVRCVGFECRDSASIVLVQKQGVFNTVLFWTSGLLDRARFNNWIRVEWWEVNVTQLLCAISPNGFREISFNWIRKTWVSGYSVFHVIVKMVTKALWSFWGRRKSSFDVCDLSSVKECYWYLISPRPLGFAKMSTPKG